MARSNTGVTTVVLRQHGPVDQVEVLDPTQARDWRTTTAAGDAAYDMDWHVKELEATGYRVTFTAGGGVEPRPTNGGFPVTEPRTVVLTRKVQTPSVELPDRFPEGIPVPLKNARVWTRTYPAGMRLDDQDHLAVASGVLARHEDNPARFTRDTTGRLVENLAGVPFDALDVGYLDYVRGTRSVVAEWIAAYANGAGESRFSDAVHDGVDDRKEVGWMYATLGTLLAYQGRRDSECVDSPSGFCPWDDTADDGWYAGRSWGNEARDWQPGVHEAGRLLDEIRGSRTQATYGVMKAGEVDDPRLGRIKWKSTVEVQAKDGSPSVTLPGQWLVTWTRKNGLEFADRHAWGAILWAIEELRGLYTRVVELGPDCVPEGDDSGLGPVGWAITRVNDVMARVPNGDDTTRGVLAELDRLARRVADEARRIPVPEAEPTDPYEFLDLVELAKAVSRRARVWKRERLARQAAAKRAQAENHRRLTRSFFVERINDDVAICEAWDA